MIAVIVFTCGSVSAMVTWFYDIWGELWGVKLKGDKMDDIILISLLFWSEKLIG